MTSVEVHTSAAPLAEEWDELALRVGAPPFARPGWGAAWWSAFGEGKLEILALRGDHRLDGVLPLARRNGTLTATANSHTPLFEAVASDRRAATDLIEAAVARSSRRLELTGLNAAGPTAAAFDDLGARADHRIRVRETRRPPIIRLGSDPALYAQVSKSSTRRDLRRRRRRLEEIGPVEVEWADGTERLAEFLAEGFAIEGSGWKDAAGTAIASSPQTVEFYSAVARWAASCGLLRLGFLRLAGRAIAFSFSIWDRPARTIYVLKAGYDAELGKLAPGRLLLSEQLAAGASSGYATVEMGGDADSYKLRFTEELGTIVRAQAFATTVRGRVDRLGQSYALPAARRLRERAAGRLTTRAG